MTTRHLGATGNMAIREKYLPIFSFEQTRLTRHHQSLWPGVYKNHEPALATIMNRRWQQSWTGVGNNHDLKLSVFLNRWFLEIIDRQVLHFQPGWISVEYLKTNIFFKSEHWRPIQMDSLFTKYLLQANWLWSWSIEPDFPEEGNDKYLRMFMCWFTKILNPEHNLSNLFLCLFCSISLPWVNPS